MSEGEKIIQIESTGNGTLYALTNRSKIFAIGPVFDAVSEWREVKKLRLDEV